MSVFVCYCHADRAWSKRLESILLPMVGHGLELWSDRRIQKGSQWRKEFEASLGRARVVVLLVSAPFLASDFIKKRKIPPLLAWAQQNGLPVLWIPIGVCAHQRTTLGAYQPVWDPRSPLKKLSEEEADEALAEIAESICHLAGGSVAGARSSATVSEVSVRGTRSQLAALDNPCFVGRERELEELHKLLRKGHALISQVTTGAGGIGKTQLALQYARQYGKHYDGVYTLSMAVPEGIDEEFVRLGSELKLYEYDDPSPATDKLDLVRSFLKRTRRRVLLVFDNCENEALYSAWRPASSRVGVLLTSRQANWRSELGLGELFLDVLARPASVDLLRKLAPSLSEAEATRVAEALGDFPLALQLAGGYLNTYAGLESVDSYLSALATGTPEGTNLLGVVSGLCSTNHEQNVATVFAHSLGRLDPARDFAALDMLAMLSWYAPGEAIPLKIIPAPVRIGVIRRFLSIFLTWLRPSGNPKVTAKALRRLEVLGLVRCDGTSVAPIHALCHGLMSRLEQRDAVSSRVAFTLDNAAQDVNSSDDPLQLDPWRVHLRHLILEGVDNDAHILAWLCNSLATNLKDLTFYDAAQPLYEQALALAQSSMDKADIADFANKLAILHILKGEYDAAEPLYRRALELAESDLGPNHAGIADPLNNLADLLRDSARYEEAEPLYRRAILIAENNHGPNHPSLGSYFNNLAVLLADTQRTAEAEPLYRRALAIDEANHGPNHPILAGHLNNLAGLLANTRRLPEAKALMERAVSIFDASLGPNHPRTQMAKQNLANLRA